MFTVYSKDSCGFCEKSKSLLKARQVPFKEIRIFGGDPQPGVEYITADELRAKIPGVRSVPQIFDGDKLIGGYTELTKYLAP